MDKTQRLFDTDLSAIRAVIEHAVADLKTWRMLSDYGGRYRSPISKILQHATSHHRLLFFTVYE